MLSIHLPAAPSDSEKRAVIKVYHVLVDKKSGKTNINQIKRHSVKLRTNAGGRVDINLTFLTRIWQKNPEENLGIVVKAQVDQSNQKELEIGGMGSREGPYLTIDIHDTGFRHRTKRTTINRICREDYDATVSPNISTT